MEINYLEEAKKHEKEFRAILDTFDFFPNKDLTIEEIFEKYSTGNRMGRWTVLSFSKREDGLFSFGFQNTAPLSGLGRKDLWKFDENGTLKQFQNESHWRS